LEPEVMNLFGVKYFA